MRISFVFVAALISLSVTGIASALPPEVVVDQPDPPSEEYVGNWSWPGSPKDGIAIDSTLVNDEDPCAQLGLPSCEISEFPASTSSSQPAVDVQLATGHTVVTSETIDAVSRNTNLDPITVLGLRNRLRVIEAIGAAPGGEQCYITSAAARVRTRVRVKVFLQRIRTIVRLDAQKAYCGYANRETFTYRSAARKMEVRFGSGCRAKPFPPAFDDPQMEAYPADYRTIPAGYWDSRQAADFVCKLGDTTYDISLCLRAEMFGGFADWYPCPYYEREPEFIKFRQVLP